MKQTKVSHEATRSLHRQRRDASAIPVCMIALLACAALVGSATYLRAGDTLAQSFGGADNQNELPGPTNNITIEMHEGTNMNAFPSPDGTKMVLSLQGGLWIMPASGGTATKITPWDVESTQPAWSPDGQWIAFQNYSTDANYAIWVVKSDGSQLHSLTSGPFDDREPSWYPDSSKVIFSSDRSNDKQYKIWSVTLGGTLQQLTTGTGAESNPVVSPDGTKIAFVNNGNTIFTMPANLSAAPTQFGSGNYPQFTPNSQGLVYQNTAGNLVVNGNEVTSGEDLFPFPVEYMGPNKFVYTGTGKILTRDSSGGSVQTIAFSATQVLRRPVITPLSTRPSLGATTPQPVKGINGAVISPDGQSVAFIALNDLWMMKIGEAPVRLTSDTDRDVDPRWTADGRFIYWSTDKNNAGNLAVDKIDVVTKQRTRVAAIQGVSMIQPTLSPTEDRFAYSTGSGLTEVMDISTRTRTPLVAQLSPQPQVGRPSWTRDGTKLMIVDNDRINPRFREGYNKLRVIDIATKTATWYAVGPAPAAISDRTEGAAVLSPDGTKVAFVSDSVLKVMPTNADGSPSGPAVQLTNEVSDMLSWQADSQTLLYMSAGKLKKIKADGTGQQDVALSLTYTPAAPTGTTIIHAGALFWGGSPIMKHNVDIIIKGNRIASIGPHFDRPQTPDTTFVDASQQTVLPGYWDPHFHPLNVYQGSQFNLVWAAMFAYGFTSVQSVAGPIYSSTEIREALDAGNLVGPRLFTSTPLLEGNRMSYDMSRGVRNAQVADLEVARFAAVDIDWIKTYVRDPIPAMNRFAAAAQSMGIPSGTHLLYPGYSTGLQGITHLQATQRMGYGWAKSPTGVAYQDVNALVGLGQVHLTETLSANFLAAQSPILLGGDRFNVLMPIPYVSSLLAQQPGTPAQLATLKIATDDDARAIAAGALFAQGTDVPLNPPGVTNHSNLMALGRSMSNFQALQAITINAAKMSFKDKDLGSVEVGKLADLTIVDGDPLQDLKYAAAVHWVVKNGVVYTLDQIIAPFKSPAQMAARRKALVAFDKACKEDSRNCFAEAHSAGD